jgi:hypothetical protein
VVELEHVGTLAAAEERVVAGGGQGQGAGAAEAAVVEAVDRGHHAGERLLPLAPVPALLAVATRGRREAGPPVLLETMVVDQVLLLPGDRLGGVLPRPEVEG